MKVSAISIDDVWTSAVRALGLDEQSIAIDYPEAICASLRRAASFLCPATPRAVVDTVLEVLTPILDDPPTRDDLVTTLDQLISTGDLLELAEKVGDQTTRLLYLGPPSFIEVEPGRCLVTGVRPLSAPLLSADLNIAYEGHLRTVVLDPGTADARLRIEGLHKISAAQWCQQPSTLPAAEYVEQFRQRLGAAKTAGFVDGLTIMDPAARPTYYRGRWRAPATGDTGDFVGRRPQAYGADRWCFVRLADGAPERLLDLPVADSITPGRDDAWRLQAALDAVRRAPLSYRLRPLPRSESTATIIDLFSPLPSWAERYLGLIGTSVDKSRAALFSYRVPNAALSGLQSVLNEVLWMNSIIDGND